MANRKKESKPSNRHSHSYWLYRVYKRINIDYCSLCSLLALTITRRASRSPSPHSRETSINKWKDPATLRTVGRRRVEKELWRGAAVFDSKCMQVCHLFSGPLPLSSFFVFVLPLYQVKYVGFFCCCCSLPLYTFIYFLGACYSCRIPEQQQLRDRCVCVCVCSHDEMQSDVSLTLCFNLHALIQIELQTALRPWLV